MQSECAQEITTGVDSIKPKRSLVRFEGANPTAINLEHVTHMLLSENKITFTFYNNAIFIDFEDQETAKKAFDNLMNIWGDV